MIVRAKRSLLQININWKDTASFLYESSPSYKAPILFCTPIEENYLKNLRIKKPVISGRAYDIERNIRQAMLEMELE